MSTKIPTIDLTLTSTEHVEVGHIFIFAAGRFFAVIIPLVRFFGHTRASTDQVIHLIVYADCRYYVQMALKIQVRKCRTWQTKDYLRNKNMMYDMNVQVH